MIISSGFDLDRNFRLCINDKVMFKRSTDIISSLMFRCISPDSLKFYEGKFGIAERDY